MRSPQRFSNGKKHGTSIITRKRVYIHRERAKYPFLADKIVQMSDIILEILDARFIGETRNPELEKKIHNEKKKIIYVFNKADLVDIKKLRAKYDVSLTPRVFVSCVSRKGIKELRDKIKITALRIINPVDKALNKITVGVIGYPNTGKSSLINLLVGKNASGIGADAGFTKGIIKATLTSNIVLLDSPGVIPNKEYSSSNMLAMSRHTKVGARSYSQVKHPDVAVAMILEEFPDVLEKFYKVISEGDSEKLMEELGRKKGFLKKGGEVDEDKIARFILKDWQEGRIRI